MHGKSILALAAVMVLAAAPVWAAAEPARLLAVFADGVRSTWDAAVRELSRKRVVFLGEQHDDPATHELELAALRALHETGDPVVLSLEMFETDVQDDLDAYLAGRLTEAEFLARSRPWNNYRTDYRPLVEYAKANGIPVVAANVPRRLASRAHKEGLAAVKAAPPEQRAWATIPASCPDGRAFERFKERALEHPGVTADSAARMFEAQCLKDATMAGSIVKALAGASPDTTVLHVNGSFHSDFGDGVPAMLRLQAPGTPLGILTVRPTDSVPVALPRDLVGAADFTAFVEAPRSPPPAPPVATVSAAP